MAKKRKIKIRPIYALLPIGLIALLMVAYFFFVSVPQNSKKDFLQIAFRAWHIQNSLNEFFVADDYLKKMTESLNYEELNIRYKEVNKSRVEKGKLYANELSIIRKNCEEISLCRKSEFGLLAINNLEGFADAIRNDDLNLAMVYKNNETDFLRLFKYDLLNYKGKLDSVDLSRMVALGNADLLIEKKLLAIDEYCKMIRDEFKNDPLYLKYCSQERIKTEMTEKTCYTENEISGEKECKRSKEYLKQIKK